MRVDWHHHHAAPMTGTGARNQMFRYPLTQALGDAAIEYWRLHKTRRNIYLILFYLTLILFQRVRIRILHRYHKVSLASLYSHVLVQSLSPIFTVLFRLNKDDDDGDNRERKCAENYKKWHNKFIFLNCNQHFANFES